MAASCEALWLDVCGTLLPLVRRSVAALVRRLASAAAAQLDIVTGLERLVVAAVVSLPENIVDVADAV